MRSPFRRSTRLATIRVGNNDRATRKPLESNSLAAAWDAGYDAAWDDSDTEHPIPEPKYRETKNPFDSGRVS